MVRAFNARLLAGGQTETQFPESCILDLPRLPDRDLYQESFLLVLDGQVRGGYILKHQKAAICGTVQPIACGPQLPLSEGTVDPKYGLLGVSLLRHALRQQPLLFALGMGGMENPYPRLLRAAGWAMLLVPFYFKIINPTAFLENVQYSRLNRAQSTLLGMIRRTGIASACARILHMRFGFESSVEINQVSEFGPWADTLWDQCRKQYSFVAVRDSRTLNVIYPREDSRFLRLQVSRHGTIIGWALLLDTQMSGHKYFGNMHLGSIVDCLAEPQNSAAVSQAATRFLEGRQVDLIVSNQASSAWGSALVRSGFVRGPSNYVLALSCSLAKKLQPIDKLRSSVHINRGDGDGPINL